MKVTMQQIAQELDYSQSTVSRSLRHDSSISPETKANVFAVAHRLGYKVRSPKPQKRAKTCWHVGLLYSGEDEKIKAQDTVLARLLEGIVQEAESAGVRINLHLTKPHLDNKHSGIEHMPSLMRERKADALVIQGANHNEEDILRYSKSFPIVSFNRIYRGLGLDCVVSENMWSVKCLVEKLISLGHRQMCWIKASSEASFDEQRLGGFLTAIAKAGLPLSKQHLLSEDYSKSPHLPKKDLLKCLKQGVTAFVCSNDQIALDVCKLLAEENLYAPKDFSVTGYDHVLAKTQNNLSLSTVEPHIQEIGALCIRKIIDRLERPTLGYSTVVVPAKIIQGETIAKPPKKSSQRNR